MARRYGGRYSPDAGGADAAARAPRPAEARRDPAGARSNLLFLPPVVLGFTSLWAGAAGLATGLAGAAALLLGAWLLRDGLRAEAAYAERAVARRPAIPRKTFAALACGAGTALATLDAGAAAAALYGGAAGVLHLGAFGLDPFRDKGMGDAVGAQGARVARVVDEAERYLSDLIEATRRAGDRKVEARAEAFAGTVRDLIRTVEADPRDLTAARRYLGVYLMGARDAARKFADLYARTGDAKARADFLALLDDLEDGFGRKTRTLLLDNATDLQVEIDVLRDRLGREGVRLDP